MSAKKYIVVLFFVVFSIMLKAQDAHYSQFYNSNAILNPALTGVFDGQQRVTLHYRDQWSSVLRAKAYRTVSGQFDAKMHTKNQDFLTYGLDFTRDQSGDAGYLQQFGHLNIGYIKQIGSNPYSSINHFLVGGLKLGFGQNRVDTESLWFGTQFDVGAGGVDLSRPSNEDLINMNGRSPLYGDFGFGLMYYNVAGERKSTYIGISANHLNQPTISLTEFGNIRMKRIFSGHLGGEYPINKELSIMPNAAIFIQGPSRMFMPGAHVRYSHRDWKEIALRVGMWTRLVRSSESALMNDALIFSATIEYEAFLFGISYDVTTSSFITANSGRGAAEFSVQYRNRNTKYRKPITCPKF